MTPDQEKVIGRCKRMLKLAFPEMTGKIIFRLLACKLGSKGIDVDMFIPSVRIRSEDDREVTEVVL